MPTLNLPDCIHSYKTVNGSFVAQTACFHANGGGWGKKASGKANRIKAEGVNDSADAGTQRYHKNRGIWGCSMETSKSHR